MPTDPGNRVDILLVENNPTNAELCVRSLKKHNLANRLVWVKDGRVKPRHDANADLALHDAGSRSPINMPVRLPSAVERAISVEEGICARKAAERELRESEAKFRSLVEQNVAGIAIIREDGTIAYINPCYAATIGYTPSELIGRPLLDIIPEAEKDVVTEKLRSHFVPGAGLLQLETMVEAKDGRIVDVLINASPGIFEGRPASIAVGIDITARKEAELALARLNRILRTLRRGNEVVVHAATELELFGKMCRTIVETGGYRMAWVGVVEHDSGKSMRPVAWAGEVGDYLEKAQITWGEGPHGNGPTGRAVRTGAPQVTRDFATDPRMAPWLDEARKHGFASSVGLPLKDGEAFAVLMIYADQPDGFDDAALNLLQELAGDLAFGIKALREHAKAAAAEARWRASLEATVGAIASTVEMRDPYTAGHQQRVARLAVAMARALQMPEHQIKGLYLAGIIHDVGKINIPAEILSNPGKLTKLQFQLIQGHAEAGYDIVKGIDFPWPIAEIIYQHHERLDGSGYPRGLTGAAILPEAKILAVADVVDAMMSHRPYRASRGLDAALAEIEKGRGKIYDWAAADACIALLRDPEFKLS